MTAIEELVRFMTGKPVDPALKQAREKSLCEKCGGRLHFEAPVCPHCGMVRFGKLASIVLRLWIVILIFTWVAFRIVNFPFS